MKNKRELDTSLHQKKKRHPVLIVSKQLYQLLREDNEGTDLQPRKKSRASMHGFKHLPNIDRLRGKILRFKAKEVKDQREQWRLA